MSICSKKNQVTQLMLDIQRIWKRELNFTTSEKGPNLPEVENGSSFTAKPFGTKVKLYLEKII